MQPKSIRNVPAIALAAVTVTSILCGSDHASAGKTGGGGKTPPAAGKSSTALRNTTLGSVKSVKTDVRLDGQVGASARGTRIGPNDAGVASIRPMHGVSVPAGAPRHVFYSFEKFDVGAGGPVTFSGPANGDPDVGVSFSNLQSVVARVTGPKSLINGRIAVAFDGVNPSLYLVNPSGLVFGPNAVLDVKGAVVLSTAARLDVGDTDMAGVTIDAEPGSLLRVASIDSFGFGDTPAELSFCARADGATRFAIADGKTLSMVAGNITVDRTNVVAASGRVNVVSVGSAGDVAFDATRPNADAPSLPSGMTMGDVQLQSVSTRDASDSGTSKAYISTGGIDGDGDLGTGPAGTSGEGGRIVIRAGKLTLIGGEARVTANTEMPKPGEQAAPPTARGIDIALTGKLSLQSGAIEASTAHIANAGAISITAGALDVWDGGRIDTSARSVNKDVNASSGIPIGNAGPITIDLADGPLTMTRTAPTRNDQGVIQVDRVNEIKSNAEDFGVNTFSRGGDITITAGDVDVGLLSRISASTESGGDAGNITVTAKSVTIANPEQVTYTNDDGSSETVPLGPHGTGGDGTNDFRILSVEGNTPAIDATSKTSSSFVKPISNGGVELTGAGNAGVIAITADNLLIQRGGRIRVDTMGERLSGDESVVEGTTVIAGGGAAGTVQLKVKDTLTAAGNEAGLKSFATSVTANSDFFVIDVDTGEVRESGPAGVIDIRAGDIVLADGARIQAEGKNSSFGGGVITIGGVDAPRAKSLEMSDGAQITTRVGMESSGRAGDIRIGAERVRLVDSATPAPSGRKTEASTDGNETAIKASTISQNPLGAGGNVSIDAVDLTINEGAVISTNAADVSATGPDQIPAVIPSADAGSIAVRADRLTVTGVNARLQSLTEGVGKAGQIDIVAGDVEVTDGGVIAVETRFTGDGGFLNLNAQNVLVNDGGTVSSRSTVSETLLEPDLVPGRAGNIRIRADDSVTVGGTDRGASIRASANGSDGGNIRIFAADLVAVLHNGQIITEGSTNGGDIRIGGTTGAELPTIADNTAQALPDDGVGDITLRPDVVIAESPRSIVSDAKKAFAGDIFIELGQSGGLIRTDGALSAHSDNGPQFDGQILVQAPGDDESLELVEIREGLMTVAAQLHDCCELRLSRDLSSFIVKPLPALPFDPAGWRPVTPLAR